MKILKYLLIVIITLVLVVYLLDLQYLVNGVSKTYLKGNKGPIIYDRSFFDQENIDAGNTNNQFYLKSVKHQSQFPEDVNREMMAIETEYFSVSKGDSLFFEFQTQENSTEKLSNSFSVAKSFTTLCVAKAIELGKIKSWEEPIGNYISNLKPNVAKQGIGNFLAMCSGLDWSESGANPFSDNAKAYYGKNLNALVKSKDAEPNDIGKFIYKSGNTQFAAILIEKATGLSLPKFFEKYFWKEIAHNDASWGKDGSDGSVKAYCCVYAEGQDFHRMGQLMIDSGFYNGKQLLNTNVFNTLYKPYAKTTINNTPNKAYGVGFWLENYKGHDIVYARGILGQYIICVPDLDLVICRIGKQRLPTNSKMHPKDLYLYLDFAFTLI